MSPYVWVWKQGENPCILSSSYSWRRWENLLQGSSAVARAGSAHSFLWVKNHSSHQQISVRVSTSQVPTVPPHEVWRHVRREGQGRLSRFWSHLSGGQAGTQNQGACCSSLHQRKSLFSLSLRERHWVCKVVTREFFFFLLLFCHFVSLVILLINIHPCHILHTNSGKARLFA